jgi:alpha-beta hydrolase superfamily lysophospholipase
MPNWLVWYPLRLLQRVLAATGLLALLLVAMVATPLKRPGELRSVAEAARSVDRSTMPPLERFAARDGTDIAYRHDPARGGVPVGKIAIVMHGSSGSSPAVSALADALAGRGVEIYAPDIRGHGGSGTRGDIAYLSQLENDFEDLVLQVRKAQPNEPITLLGHSAGGGFALRIASSSIHELFARAVLLAPYLGYDAPTNQPHSGGWASADIPRVLALQALRGLGITCCEALPTLTFAVPPNSEHILAATYSYRLMRNFATRGYKADFAATTIPVTLFSGTDDELMLSDEYADAGHAVAPKVDVKLIDGVDPMGIVGSPTAVAVVAENVAKAGAGP